MTRRGGFLAAGRAAWVWWRAGRRSFTYPYMPVLERIAHALEAQVPRPLILPEPWIDATTWFDTNRSGGVLTSTEGVTYQTRNCSPHCPCRVDIGGDD